MDKVYVMIEVILNHPRLTYDYPDPVEAIIRRAGDGTILHNIFAPHPSNAQAKAVEWCRQADYNVGGFHWHPELKIYERSLNLGARYATGL